MLQPIKQLHVIANEDYVKLAPEGIFHAFYFKLSWS